MLKSLAVAVVNVHAAESQLSRLLDAAVAGDEAGGKRVARLVPLTPPKERRKLGALAGKLHVADDLDDPLPDGLVADFEGR